MVRQAARGKRCPLSKRPDLLALVLDVTVLNVTLFMACARAR
jgi:hypothetical protein